MEKFNIIVPRGIRYIGEYLQRNTWTDWKHSAGGGNKH